MQQNRLDHSLIDLVKTPASQITGCAYCIDMHTGEARARGETEERLYLLYAWHQSPLYSECERAAPAWTETLLQPGIIGFVTGAQRQSNLDPTIQPD